MYDGSGMHCTNYFFHWTISLNHFCKMYKFFVRSSHITKPSSLIERSFPISVHILALQGTLPVNQHYSTLQWFYFPIYQVYMGQFTLKETHTATEHTIINSGLCAFKTTLKASLKCLLMTFRHVVLTVPLYLL